MAQKAPPLLGSCHLPLLLQEAAGLLMAARVLYLKLRCCHGLLACRMGFRGPYLLQALILQPHAGVAAAAACALQENTQLL